MQTVAPVKLSGFDSKQQQKIDFLHGEVKTLQQHIKELNAQLEFQKKLTNDEKVRALEALAKLDMVVNTQVQSVAESRAALPRDDKETQYDAVVEEEEEEELEKEEMWV